MAAILWLSVQGLNDLRPMLVSAGVGQARFGCAKLGDTLAFQTICGVKPSSRDVVSTQPI